MYIETFKALTWGPWALLNVTNIHIRYNFDISQHGRSWHLSLAGAEPGAAGWLPRADGVIICVTRTHTLCIH